MSGAAGAQIGAAGTQPPIGTYVQDALDPTTSTNVIGVDVGAAYKTNVMGVAIDPAYVVPGTQGATVGDLDIQWVKSASVLVPTDKVTIALGVATKDNVTGTHSVFATVAVDDYFWAVEDAP